MKMAKVSSTCEGRGRKRSIGEEESSRMERMCAKARKSSNGENAGALSSACMERVMTRRMLREALDVEERRVTEMLMEQERRYKEILMERERSAFIDIENIEVITIEDDEEEVNEKKDEEKRESEAIGDQALAEDKVEEVAARGEVLEKPEESRLALDPDDWGWTWSCEEKQKWWESVCYPYWETMSFDWVDVDDQELPWEDDLWNLLDIKEVPKDLKK
jgi:hypothetical protein